jgi:hypothetical protein
MANSLGEVFVLKTSERATGIPEILKKLGLEDYSEKNAALKANYNNANMVVLMFSIAPQF